jgi:formate dehydrogenase
MPTAAEALADGAPKKVLMVLYAGGDHAKTTPALLGCAENALGLREWLESLGHTVVATADKEGPGCELDTHLPDADIVITTPFHPGYISAERIAAAPKLKLALTAGVGSDHVDLPAASAAGLIVAEVTGCNVVSVAEHVVMQILCLVRNFAPAHAQVAAGGWDVAEVAAASWDLEGKVGRRWVV